MFRRRSREWRPTRDPGFRRNPQGKRSVAATSLRESHRGIPPSRTEITVESNETRKWKGDHFPPLHLFKPLDFTRPRGAALDRARFGSLAGRRSLGVSSRATSADRRLKVGHDGVLLSRDVAEKERHDLDGTEEEDEQHQVNLE